MTIKTSTGSHGESHLSQQLAYAQQDMIERLAFKIERLEERTTKLKNENMELKTMLLEMKDLVQYEQCDCDEPLMQDQLFASLDIAVIKDHVEQILFLLKHTINSARELKS